MSPAVDPVELRPLGVGEILDVAIKIYRAHFVTLVKTVAVVAAPVAVVGAVVRLSTGPSPGNVTTTSFRFGNQPDVVNMSNVWTGVAGALVVGLLSYAATQLAVGASFRAVSEGYLGGAPDWRRSIRFALSRLRSLTWVAFLVLFLAGLGLLACIVPGVYFWGSWSVAIPVLLLEGARGRKALRRSRQLVRGRWWPTAGTVILASLLASIVQGALSAALIAVTFSGANDVVSALVNAIVQIVSLSLVTPFTASVSTVLYFDLRVRKEGYDIELMASHVGVEPGDRPSLPLLPPPPAPPPGAGDRPPYWPPPPGWRPTSAPDG